ncbi:MAG: TIM-barrel domain-containing protein [Candidatus Acidiferrum sp.]
MKTQRAASSKTKAACAFRRLVLLTLLSGFLFLPITFAHAAAVPQTSQAAVAQPDAVNSRSLPNGIEIRRGNFVLQVVALREDVLRIRESAKSELPEDASWAVPVEIRHQSVQVTPESAAGTVGFHTKALRTRIDQSTLSLSITDLEGNVVQEDVPAWPPDFHQDAFRIYKKMPADEHYFGLGDKTGGLDRRAHAFRMWNTDAFLFQESTDPIYKSIPFFLTMRAGRSAGVLVDNTWSSSFDFGTVDRNKYSFGAEGGPIDYYVFCGPDPKQVIRTYAWLTGLPPLPPLWSLGFQQSRYSYETEARVREIAARLRADKIPADVLYLDIDFQQEHRPFTVDTTKFPHFAQMLADLKRENFHVVAITDLHIARLPGADYAPYDSGVAGDHFVKNADGSTYVGSVWPGPSVFPDFTQQETREWWGTLYKNFLADGVAGFWNDMGEPSVFLTPLLTMPDNAQHRIDEPGFRPRTASHLEIHNVFGMENSRATYEGLLKLEPDVRPFVLTRATYAGGHRYAATWTGDNTASWNHLRLTTPMLLNLGLSGFGLCGADVGGFIGTPGPELLTLWTELGTFQPIDRNHANKGSGDKEVWVHGPEQEAIRRRYIEERYRLLPYLYTLTEELSRTGLPIVRPLFLEFPAATEDRHPLDLDAGNEFLLGPDLLVAPPPFAEQPDKYPLKLPPGIWYDYWTGVQVQENSAQPPVAKPPALLIQPRLDTLPVYVREGSIIPMQPLIQSTEETPQGPLTLRVYPGKPCHGTLYLDDGKTFAYTRGDFLRMEFSCEPTATGISLHIGEQQGTFHPWWKQIHVELYGWHSPHANVTTKSGSPQITVSVDSARNVVSFDIPDSAIHGTDLNISGSN